MDGRGRPDVAAGGLLVVFFHPKAFTPGCTAQACHFRDLEAEFGRRRGSATAFGARRLGSLSSKRQTFVVDADLTLLGSFHSETDMHAHADGALDLLRSAYCDPDTS